MSGEYFAEFKTGVNNAWIIRLGNWIAFEGMPSAVLPGLWPDPDVSILVPEYDDWDIVDLISLGPEPDESLSVPEYDSWSTIILASSVPSVPFRVAVITEAIEGHTDVAGTVEVNDEELSFTRATRLTSSEELTALPVITPDAVMDCKIMVELISIDGEYLQNETLTPIEIICFPKTRIMRDPSGSGWMQTNYDIWSEEPMGIGDQIRFADPHQNGQTIDVYVKNVDSAVDLELGNTQPFRVYNCA